MCKIKYGIFRHLFADEVAAFSDVFGIAAVCSFTIGLVTDITILANVAGLLLVTIVLSIVGKVISGTTFGRTYGLSPTRSFRVGLGMIPIGGIFTSYRDTCRWVE